MNHHLQPTRGLLIACLWFMLTAASPAFDHSRLNQDDQRLLVELKAAQIIQSLASKATTDNAVAVQDAAVVVPLLQAAHLKGLPLAAIMYADWMNQDQMRRVLTIEFKRSFMNGGVEWKYVPLLVDAFLAARDSPVSIYFNSSYTYRERQEMQGLERLFRDTVLDDLHFLAYPDPTTRPPRSDSGTDRGNAPTLRRMLEAILSSHAASLGSDNRKTLQAQLAKVEAFIAKPPPLPVARWRDAAAKEQAAIDELSKPVSSSATSNRNERD